MVKGDKVIYTGPHQECRGFIYTVARIESRRYQPGIVHVILPEPTGPKSYYFPKEHLKLPENMSIFEKAMYNIE